MTMPSLKKFSLLLPLLLSLLAVHGSVYHCSSEPHCEECVSRMNSTSPLCLRCREGYQQVRRGTDTRCVADIEHCVDYDYMGNCFRCSDGFLPSFGGESCNNCSEVPRCLYCGSDRRCTRCESFYILVRDNQTDQQACVHFISGCGEYTLQGECVACRPQFSLYEGLCYSCSMEHCTHCQEDFHCHQCEKGYCPTTEGRCSPCSTEGWGYWGWVLIGMAAGMTVALHSVFSGRKDWRKGQTDEEFGLIL